MPQVPLSKWITNILSSCMLPTVSMGDSFRVSLFGSWIQASVILPSWTTGNDRDSRKRLTVTTVSGIRSEKCFSLLFYVNIDSSWYHTDRHMQICFYLKNKGQLCKAKAKRTISPKELRSQRRHQTEADQLLSHQTSTWICHACPCCSLAKENIYYTTS